ncbi:hypothetical protein C2G38_2046848 [Gigaspora rosea]|uniref:SAP domain-containing protein n=1 Tax=Gigaspora rosea TaxID=44941 RepID=A0A397U7Z0_9GLOM|nr:hypothetical protein C2G38_2046848 [Gigaspora rosea]
MTDSNISKNDLSDICHSLGMSTEGNKADLVQRLKEFQAYGHQEKSADGMRLTNNKLQEDADVESETSDSHNENIEVQNPETQRLRELLRKINHSSNDILPSSLPQDTGETSDHPLQASKTSKKRKSQTEEEDPDSMFGKVLTNFQKLENAMLNFDDKLNLMAHQVQETRNKADIKEAWPKHKFEKHRDQHEYDTLRQVGRELDMAIDSGTMEDITSHINAAKDLVGNRMFTLRVAEGFGWDIASALPDTQDDWLKGKDSLIEKAKALAD